MKQHNKALQRPQYIEDKKPTRKWETKDKYQKGYLDRLNNHYDNLCSEDQF